MVGKSVTPQSRKKIESKRLRAKCDSVRRWFRCRRMVIETVLKSVYFLITKDDVNKLALNETAFGYICAGSNPFEVMVSALCVDNHDSHGWWLIDC